MDFNKNLIRKKNFLSKYALDSLENINNFANFVAYTEFLYQDDELLPDEKAKKTIKKFGGI